MKYCIAFYSALLFCFSVPAQYQVKHFTTENGLPSNGIKGLQWDYSNGFLWIATEAGIARYNGISFKTFDVISNPELGSGRIVKLIKNYKGQILVAGEEGNLSLVKENAFSLNFNGSILAKYNYNHYCAITASDTLFKQCFKTPWQANFSIHYTTVVSLNDTSSLVLDAGRLYYYAISTPLPVLIKTVVSNIKNIFQTGNRVFYVDSVNQLYAFNIKNGFTKKQEIVDADGNAFTMLKNLSKVFWQPGMESPVLIQQGKAWLIEEKDSATLQCTQIASGIPENALLNYAQYVKNENYLFLGTASKGIYAIHLNQLTTKQPASLNINQINAFYGQIELPNGNIITNAGSIIGDDPSQNNYNIGNNFLNSVFNLNDSLLVFGKSDSIFIYNRINFQKNLMLLTPSRDNFSLVISGGRLFFANQKGIGIVNENKSIDFVKLFDSSNLKNLTPSAFIEISPGKLAIASCEGLLAFDTKNLQLDTLLKLPNVCIRSMYKEGEYIFIGTYGGGFYVLKNGKIKAMPLDINSYLKYTHCFIKDKQGYCWISTNNGLFKAKMKDITDAFDKNSPQIYYHYLGKEDGMGTTEMNGGCTPCALKLKNGNFSFPTMDGLLWFNPEKTNLLFPLGKIYIDKIIINSKQKNLPANDTIYIPEQVKKIEIILAVSAWCKKENLYIDYKLNNEAWLGVEMVADEPKISIGSLNYGKNVIIIRKLNGFGADNYSYRTIVLRIVAPFYQQWWFRIAVALLVFAITYLIFKIRLRQYASKEKKLSDMVDQKTMDLNLKNIQLEKNDQIKTRLISVINHDIITPLKFMHYAGQALVENKGTIVPEQRLQTIADITQTAKEMEMLSSQILNWIIYQNPNERMQKEEFDLHQLIEMVFGVLQFPARLKNTNLQNDVPANFVVFQYLEPLRVLIYNLVLNSINFTKEGMINVECQLKDERLIITVTDNGIGMTKEQIDNLQSDEKIIASANVDNKKGTGLGYMIIKDLLKMMGGTLFITSSKSTGTAVSVSLPVK